MNKVEDAIFSRLSSFHSRRMALRAILGTILAATAYFIAFGSWFLEITGTLDWGMIPLTIAVVTIGSLAGSLLIGRHAAIVLTPLLALITIIMKGAHEQYWLCHDCSEDYSLIIYYSALVLDLVITLPIALLVGWRQRVYERSLR